MKIWFVSFPGPVSENGDMNFKVDPGTQYSIDIALGRKRRITSGENGDSDDELSDTMPPAHDIYRSRQQKRAK